MKRNKGFYILMAPDELEAVSRLAFEAGLTMSDWARRQMLYPSIPESPYEKMNLEWVSADDLV